VRLALVSEMADDPTLRKIFDSIHARQIDVPNLYLTLANSPRLLQAWTGLTNPLRHDAVSPRALRELVIMRVAQLKRAPYPWAHHWPMAVEAGITEEQLEGIGAWPDSTFDETQRAVLAYTDAVVSDTGVDAECFAGMSRRFNAEEVVELTLAATFYLNLAHLSRALDIPLEPEYERYARRLPG
jgi:4-carboxymuconolactone decarboxylase